MIITEAIKLAQTEHVVYFLLTAYVETLDGACRYGIPEPVTRLPVGSRTDVCDRWHLLQDALDAAVNVPANLLSIMEEAAHVFNVAFEQLGELEDSDASHQPLSRFRAE